MVTLKDLLAGFEATVLPITMGTVKTIRPTHLNQVIKTGSLVRKFLLKCQEANLMIGLVGMNLRF